MPLLEIEDLVSIDRDPRKSERPIECRRAVGGGDAAIDELSGNRWTAPLPSARFALAGDPLAPCSRLRLARAHAHR